MLVLCPPWSLTNGVPAMDPLQNGVVNFPDIMSLHSAYNWHIEFSIAIAVYFL